MHALMIAIVLFKDKLGILLSYSKLRIQSMKEFMYKHLLLLPHSNTYNRLCDELPKGGRGNVKHKIRIRKAWVVSTFAKSTNFYVGLCDNIYLLSHLMPTITSWINHLHPPLEQPPKKCEARSSCNLEQQVALVSTQPTLPNPQYYLSHTCMDEIKKW